MQPKRNQEKEEHICKDLESNLVTVKKKRAFCFPFVFLCLHLKSSTTPSALTFSLVFTHQLPAAQRGDTLPLLTAGAPAEGTNNNNTEGSSAKTHIIMWADTRTKGVRRALIDGDGIELD